MPPQETKNTADTATKAADKTPVKDPVKDTAKKTAKSAANTARKKPKRHVPKRRRNHDVKRLPAQPAGPTQPGAVRLVTFNAQYGTPAGGWQDAEDLLGPKDIEARIAAANDTFQATIKQLRTLNPDIVALQEVDKGQRRSGYLPHAQLIAAGLGLPYWRMFASFSGAFIGLHRRPRDSSIPNTPGHGLALASRWPVRSWRMKRLGKAWPVLDWRRVRWEGFSLGLLRGLRQLPAALGGLRIKLGLQRIVASAQVVTPFGTLSVATAHLETQKQVASTQVRRAWKSALSIHAPRCLLTGDLNLDLPEVSEALELLGSAEKPGLHVGVKSYPARRPDKALDQLLANGFRLAAEPFTVRMPISDHCAVVYDLELADSKTDNDSAKKD